MTLLHAAFECVGMVVAFVFFLLSIILAGYLTYTRRQLTQARQGVAMAARLRRDAPPGGVTRSGPGTSDRG